MNPPSAVKSLLYFRILMPQNTWHKWEIDHLQHSSPVIWPSQRCTEHPDLFLLSPPVQPHKPPLSIYIFSWFDILSDSVPCGDWRAQRCFRHPDHRFCTYSLTLDSYTVQLHYVWAQDITWDWMWCSSYCRKRSLIVHAVICFIWFFKKKIFILFCYF